MADKKTFYITTAISYVNGPPHLGHAYEVIITDVIARYKRLDGYEVMFLTGTDEHGQKIANTAEKNGMAPPDFCDKIARTFQDLMVRLNISNDDFIRTTEQRHYDASRAIWEKISGNGDIYLDSYAGWYSIREEAYFAEDELIKDEETGAKLSPNGTEVEWMEQPSYFFRLSAYTQKLLDHYEANPDFIQPASRRNEIISFVKQGLRDLSISRANFSWGVPVPGDPDHVMYVWLDALTNYLTGVGYPETESEMYQRFWPANYHIIGKDITRFHAVYWPAFLLSAGYELPRQIFAHGFINIEGQKMSKSQGNVISPDELLAMFGQDETRYLLTREIAHGHDGNFSEEHAFNRLNSDLANGLGNLAQRTLSMIYKNCGGHIPEPGDMRDEDRDLLKHAWRTMLEQARPGFDAMALHKGLEAIWQLVDAANLYIDQQAPWVLKKEDPERMQTVLYVLAEVIRCLAIAVQPVTPVAAAKLLDQLHIPDTQRTLADICEDRALPPGLEIPQPEGVFPRLIRPDTTAAV